MTANLKCPFCQKVSKAEVPKEACMVFYKCPFCGKIIKTPKGECCVICAYSDKKCPVSLTITKRGKGKK